MKRLSTGVLAVLIAALCGLNAVAAPSHAAHGNIGNNAIVADMGSTNAAPAANFGSPPSGQVPILYNDHHVYSKPDLLKKGRVLSALVRGGTVLIPLRSMFEQMGATVNYNAHTKQVTVSKPGAEIKLTVGSKTVSINGEERTLDVPPMMYKGSVLVPVRVISETMNAYVQWVPEKRVVVVRYIPPTPPPAPPTAAPTQAPVATPPPTPTPAPVVKPYQDTYVVGDYILSPKVYNEFSPGNKGTSHPFSYSIAAVKEFNLFNLPWMLEGDYRQYNYRHNQGVPTPTAYTPANNSCNVLGIPAGDPGCVTGFGPGAGQYFVPAFGASDYSTDGRLGLRVANPKIYVGVGYMVRSNNYGYGVFRGIGYGAEKLPELNKRLSVYGSYWYYPNVKTNYNNGSFAGTLSYSIAKYKLGVDYSFLHGPIFIDAGFIGDSGKAKLNVPSGFSENGPFLGLGLKF